jgi:hypothetical protein
MNPAGTRLAGPGLIVTRAADLLHSQLPPATVQHQPGPEGGAGLRALYSRSVSSPSIRLPVIMRCPAASPHSPVSCITRPHWYGEQGDARRDGNDERHGSPFHVSTIEGHVHRLIMAVSLPRAADHPEIQSPENRSHKDIEPSPPPGLDTGWNASSDPKHSVSASRVGCMLAVGSIGGTSSLPGGQWRTAQIRLL